MSAPAIGLERVFHALADRTRLGVVERLSRGPASVQQLAEPLDMALPSVMKHLRVMEDCGLVRSKKTGRVRTYRLEPRVLSVIDCWLAERRAAWNDRFDRLEQISERRGRLRPDDAARARVRGLVQRGEEAPLVRLPRRLGVRRVRARLSGRRHERRSAETEPRSGSRGSRASSRRRTA